MPTSPKLRKFVDDELQRSDALIDRVLAGTLALLRDTRDAGLARSERERQFELVEALQRQGTRFQTRFVEALRDGVAANLHRKTRPRSACQRAQPAASS